MRYTAEQLVEMSDQRAVRWAVLWGVLVFAAAWGYNGPATKAIIIAFFAAVDMGYTTGELGGAVINAILVYVLMDTVTAVMTRFCFATFLHQFLWGNI